MNEQERTELIAKRAAALKAADEARALGLRDVELRQLAGGRALLPHRGRAADPGVADAGRDGAEAMSGGSMDYLYQKVLDASFRLNTPERRAFKKHLQDVARALRAIEWNDSCDGDDTERSAIMACITKKDVLDQSIEQARAARDELDTLLERYS